MVAAVTGPGGCWVTGIFVLACDTRRLTTRFHTSCWVLSLVLPIPELNLGSRLFSDTCEELRCSLKEDLWNKWDLAFLRRIAHDSKIILIYKLNFSSQQQTHGSFFFLLQAHFGDQYLILLKLCINLWPSSPPFRLITLLQKPVKI